MSYIALFWSNAIVLCDKKIEIWNSLDICPVWLSWCSHNNLQEKYYLSRQWITFRLVCSFQWISWPVHKTDLNDSFTNQTQWLNHPVVQLQLTGGRGILSVYNYLNVGICIWTRFVNFIIRLDYFMVFLCPLWSVKSRQSPFNCKKIRKKKSCGLDQHEREICIKS